MAAPIRIGAPYRWPLRTLSRLIDCSAGMMLAVPAVSVRVTSRSSARGMRFSVRIRFLAGTWAFPRAAGREGDSSAKSKQSCLAVERSSLVMWERAGTSVATCMINCLLTAKPVKAALPGQHNFSFAVAWTRSVTSNSKNLVSPRILAWLNEKLPLRKSNLAGTSGTINVLEPPKGLEIQADDWPISSTICLKVFYR